MPGREGASDPRTVTLGTPLWKLRLPGPMTPVAFFTCAAAGLLAILWKAADSLATAGPWALSIAFAVLLLQFYLVLSVVRLVEHHPDGLMGRETRIRRRGAGSGGARPASRGAPRRER